MKKSEICLYLIIPAVCFLVLVCIFVNFDLLFDPITISTHEPIEHIYGDGKIDINTASVSTLTYLPGIGPSTAERIVRYREIHGPFRDIEDLKKISGIGDKTYMTIRRYIKVGG